MRVQVKNRSTIEGIVYAPGVHEMPDAYTDHWFFLAQIQNGNFVMGEAPKTKPAPAARLPQFNQDGLRLSQGEDAIKNIIAKGMPQSEHDESVQPVASEEHDESEKIIESDTSKKTTQATTKSKGR